MIVRYSGPEGPASLQLHPRVGRLRRARCASACRGRSLDGLVREQILAAVEPAALEASLAAVAEVERERAELSRHWQLRPRAGAVRGRAGGPAVPGVRAARTGWWAASWSGGGRRR